MSLSTHTQAVMLLTAYLGKPQKGEVKPLSPHEWGRFALLLKERSLQPESLLASDPAKLLTGLQDKTVSVRRIEALLGRGGALGFALEKWERAGLWILTRSDANYPERLKRRLRAESPPLLFGCGNRAVLGSGGLAVVGSREADEADLAFAAELGGDAARQGLSIVSGGARGIDEAAMFGALECEGTVVGVLADSLLRAAVSARYRRHLMAKNLLLLSPFNPEAGFDVGNAMARNRYIYCLSDAAVVVTSTAGRGGTWAGAGENLKEAWVPLWVKPNPDERSGNAALVCSGARWLPDRISDLATLAATETGRILVGTISPSTPPAPAQTGSASSRPEALMDGGVSFYVLFLRKLQELTSAAPLSLEQLQDLLEVVKPQLTAWLQRAAAEGRVKKLSKPVRYRWQAPQPSQPSMFGDDESLTSGAAVTVGMKSE